MPAAAPPGRGRACRGWPTGSPRRPPSPAPDAGSRGTARPSCAR
jgi:hypothetical protein